MRWLIAPVVLMAVMSGSATMAATASVDLAKVGDSIRPGQAFLARKGGALCLPKKAPTWTAEDGRWLKGLSETFRDAFRGEIKDAGLSAVGKGNDLFGSEDETAQLLVGAMINRLNVEVCSFPLENVVIARGSALMDIEWQIYSVADGKIIARIPTSGAAAKSRLHDEDWGNVLATVAFTAAARALARDEEFLKIVHGVNHATAMPSAPALNALSLILPRPATPIPMKQVGRSVVSIFAGDGMGSGVLISPDGYILTNHHIAGDSGRVRVRWSDGSETAGDVVRSDRRRDVALVKVAPTTTPTLAIRHTEVEIGETVFAIGTPLDKSLSGTLTRGVVSARRIEDGLPFIQSDVAVTHGNSGGPLLDEKGSVVGLTVSGLEPGGAPIGLNFFIPIDDALKALAIVPAG
jgi:serine protease Do